MEALVSLGVCTQTIKTEAVAVEAAEEAVEAEEAVSARVKGWHQLQGQLSTST